MFPPLVGAGEEAQSNITLLTSSASVDVLSPNGLAIKERNYLGLSDCSSVDSSSMSDTSDGNNGGCLTLKATELRLGVPGCQSPERDSEHCFLSLAKLDEKPLFPLHPVKDVSFSVSQRLNTSGNKRGFSDVMYEYSEGKFLSGSNGKAMVKSASEKDQASQVKEFMPQNAIQEMPRTATENISSHAAVANNENVSPATKAQVVGWPPVKSFRKNTLASTSKSTEEVDGKAASGALFVKVSMDGAPYLRKVDLKTYASYQELTSTLEKMFSCFTMGQYVSDGDAGNEMLSESKLKDLLHGSEYVLTYEDKDGDWMLVGDVPWEMFVDTCKKVRIMKSSDAIGLAPGTAEKCRIRN